MWEKRLNENYFKLFRKKREREKEKVKQTKQETGKGKLRQKKKEASVTPLGRRSVLPIGFRDRTADGG